MYSSAPDPNGTKPVKTIQDTSKNESIRARLPRNNSPSQPAEPSPPVLPPAPVLEESPQPVEKERKRRGAGFLPAFWTVASIISLTVNIILIIILLLTWQMLGQIQQLGATGKNQASGLLGGLYSNFVKMDQATIVRTVPVDANIPLNIVVPVQTTTSITLAEKAVIPNAHVVIHTSSMSINAPAQVTLPAGTPLTVTLDFPLTVQNTIPVHLDVPVEIPLNETELHEPFVGLQKVVQPWYCLVEPNSELNGVRVCSPTADVLPTGTVTP